MKIIIIIVLCLSFLIIAGCTTKNSSSAVTTTENTTETTTVQTTDVTTDSNAIPGSSATDIKLNLEKWNIPEASPEASSSFDGMTYSSSTIDSDTGAELRYYIAAANSFEIINATFTVTNTNAINKNDFLLLSKGFLSYCATTPYAAADSSKAKSWVEKNIALANKTGKIIKMVIGNVEFSMYGNENGVKYLEMTKSK